MLYDSNQAANNADVPGGALKYATPTIANGKVYVGSQQNISDYGLLSATRSPTGVGVNLAPAANVAAFANTGTTPANGGLDGQGTCRPAVQIPGRHYRWRRRRRAA